MVLILVVDDEAATRRVVTHTLKTINIQTKDAEDAASALALAQEFHFALALVDLNLPDMDGFTLIQQLNAVPEFQGTPIVTFTARNEPDDAMRASELGAVAFLYKPFSTQELRDLVQKHLRN